MEIKIHLFGVKGFFMLKKIRILFAGTYFVILTPIFCFIFLFRPKHPSNGYWLTKAWCIVSNKIMGVKMIFKDLHHMRDNTPCVFIANHQSNYDVLFFGHIFPKRCVSIGKKSLAYIPFFGWLYWLSGHILIDRSNKEKAYATMDKARQALVNKATSLWLFPEGTRSKGKGLLEFKKGAFRTAIESGRPIVPIIANSYLKTLNLNKLKSGDVVIKALPAIPTKNVSMDQLDELIDKTRNVMLEQLHQLDQLYSKAVTL